MKLPRQCKICNLLLHYPDYNSDNIKFFGKGYCPQMSKIIGGAHYEIMVNTYENETSDHCEVLSEKFIYEELLIQLAHHEKVFYFYKDGRKVECPELLYDEVKELVYKYCKNKDHMLDKLDTLVNFS